jgi:hypothetical protein
VFDCNLPARIGGRHVRGTRTPVGWYVATYARAEQPWCDAADAVADEAMCRGTSARTGELVHAGIEPAPLYLDGGGWDIERGTLAPAAIFYARDPELVELELESDARDVAWETAVRVAVGAVRLAPIAFASTERGVRIRYASPSPLPVGIATIFLAVGDRSELDRATTAFRLHAIRWRGDTPRER